MKKNIALITGGSSGELEISLNSAKVISQQLDKNLFHVFTVVIQGKDWIFQEATSRTYVDKNDFSLTLDGKKYFFDCVFIAIHGTPGEDGKLQGYFDMLGIPYTACDVYTSSLTFNKFFTNLVVENLGIKTGKLQILKLGKNFDSQILVDQLGLPCFVKPNKNGSSVGITKVKNEDELVPAIEEAFRHDDEVLVQKLLKGIEITCGLLRYKDELVILPLCEVVSKKEFFDYEAKYTDGMADEIVPARISDELTKKCQDLSAFLYEKLNCKGIVRFDYMLSGEEFYFLEVNSIPGLSQNSIVPKMARNMGLEMKELFTMAIEESIHWHGKRRKYINGVNHKS
ncbi:MAG: D-alanine--D-alanine ligase [Bacteroidales bacterium]|nr:D-alanine--D-alanine ligase [Bacteroidales bacterium]